MGLAEGQRDGAAAGATEQQVGASAGAGEQPGVPVVGLAGGQLDGAAVGVAERQNAAAVGVEAQLDAAAMGVEAQQGAATVDVAEQQGAAAAGMAGQLTGPLALGLPPPGVAGVATAASAGSSAAVAAPGAAASRPKSQRVLRDDPPAIPGCDDADPASAPKRQCTWHDAVGSRDSMVVDALTAQALACRLLLPPLRWLSLSTFEGRSC